MLVAIADTHAVLWYLSADPRLSITAKNIFATTAHNIGARWQKRENNAHIKFGL